MAAAGIIIGMTMASQPNNVTATLDLHLQPKANYTITGSQDMFNTINQNYSKLRKVHEFAYCLQIENNTITEWKPAQYQEATKTYIKGLDCSYQYNAVLHSHPTTCGLSDHDLVWLGSKYRLEYMGVICGQNQYYMYKKHQGQVDKRIPITKQEN